MNNQTIPQQIERLDTDRLRAYSESLGFYAGGQWAGRSRRKERRLTFNYARSFDSPLIHTTIPTMPH